MRFSLAALSFAVLAACGPSVAAPGSLADVKLDPKIETVRAANDFEGVEFFALDYSARDETTYFADAETLGIAETMREIFPEKIKTGQLYLIDRSSGDVLSTVTKSMSEAEIVAAIDGALS